MKALFVSLLIPLAASGVEITVHFSPRGGCSEAIVAEINRATNAIHVQAYNFTSDVIGDALAGAAQRGISVIEIQDNIAAHQKNFQGPKLIAAGGQVFIDAKHKIAHSKTMVIDDRTVITGSFNFSDNAENSNAENLLVIRDDVGLAAQYSVNWSNHLSHSTSYKPPQLQLTQSPKAQNQ